MYTDHAPTHTTDILVVDDNEFDMEAVQRAFKKSEIKNTMYHAIDGVEALKILSGENNDIKISQPSIILLDINMPRMDGFTLLENLRSKDILKQHIVFMLTTSARSQDISLAYDFSVAGYFIKKDLRTLSDMLHTYLDINKLPTMDQI